MHGARHEVAGRLVAGHGEEEEEELELELAQLLAVDLDGGEHAHEVGVGVDALLAEELGGVGVELHGGDHGLFGLALVLGVLVAHHAVGPLEHAVAVLLGDAEELGDDLEGELGREVGDEVGLGPVSMTESMMASAERWMLSSRSRTMRGREALVDEAPVAGVQGRVHVEHHQALLGLLVVGHLEGHGALGGRAEALVVPVDGDAVVVAGDGPEAGAAGLVLPVHRVVAAQVGQVGVGDTGHEGPGVGQIDGGDVGDGAGHRTTPLADRTLCPILCMVRPEGRGSQRNGASVLVGGGAGVGAGSVAAAAPVAASGRGGSSGSGSGKMATDLVGSSGSRTTRSCWSASGGSPGTEATMTTSCWVGAKMLRRPLAMLVPTSPMADSRRQRSKPPGSSGVGLGRFAGPAVGGRVWRFVLVGDPPMVPSGVGGGGVGR